MKTKTKLELKIIMSCLLGMIFTVMIPGYIIPILVSAKSDIMVVSGGILTAVSIVVFYFLIKYLIIQNLQKLIKGDSN